MGKLFAILVAIALGGVLLIGAVGWYWWHNHSTELLEAGKTAIGEGEAAGRQLEEGTCIVLAIERHKADWNLTMTSAVRINLWLGGCLETSRAQERFCDGVPDKDDVLAAGLWAASSCARHGLSDSYCGNLFSTVARYCASPKRAGKLSSGLMLKS